MEEIEKRGVHETKAVYVREQNRTPHTSPQKNIKNQNHPDPQHTQNSSEKNMGPFSQTKKNSSSEIWLRDALDPLQPDREHRPGVGLLHALRIIETNAVV